MKQILQNHVYSTFSFSRHSQTHSITIMDPYTAILAGTGLAVSSFTAYSTKSDNAKLKETIRKDKDTISKDKDIISKDKDTISKLEDLYRKQGVELSLVTALKDAGNSEVARLTQENRQRESVNLRQQVKIGTLETTNREHKSEVARSTKAFLTSIATLEGKVKEVKGERDFLKEELEEYRDYETSSDSSDESSSEDDSQARADADRRVAEVVARSAAGAAAAEKELKKKDEIINLQIKEKESLAGALQVADQHNKNFGWLLSQKDALLAHKDVLLSEASKRPILSPEELADRRKDYIEKGTDQPTDTKKPLTHQRGQQWTLEMVAESIGVDPKLTVGWKDRTRVRRTGSQRWEYVFRSPSGKDITSVKGLRGMLYRHHHFNKVCEATGYRM